MENLTNAGSAAGGAGIVTAIFSWLFKRWMDRVDQEIKGIKDGVVWKDTCDKCSGEFHRRLADMHEDIKYLVRKANGGIPREM